MTNSADAWTEAPNQKALADAKVLFGSKLLEPARAQTSRIVETLVEMDAPSGTALLSTVVEIVGAKNAQGKPAHIDLLPHIAQIGAAPDDDAEVKQMALTLLRNRERGSAQGAQDFLKAAREAIKP